MDVFKNRVTITSSVYPNNCSNTVSVASKQKEEGAVTRYLGQDETCLQCDVTTTQ